MKPIPLAIVLTAIPAGAVLRAQPAPRTAGGMAERCQQLDRNGDGKVTRAEAAQLPMFDQWDANQDGAVTLEEGTAFDTNRRVGAGKDIAPTSLPTPFTRPRPAADGFVPEAPFVGEIGGSYIDPEFSESASQVVFQDAQNRVWIGDIDPATGRFKSATGRDDWQMSMWSAVSPHFLFVQTPPGAPHGQVAMSDADRGAVRVLTSDAGAKDDPGLFLAPEFGGELLLVCNVDKRALAIYRDEQNRFVRRVDDSASSVVLEPEPFVGTEEVYIYYERKSPETDRGELRRCRTGISTLGRPSATSTPPAKDRS